MDIIAIGECMVEFFCDGKFSRAEVFKKSYGGDTLNTLIAASRLGSKTGYITKVGNDAFAEYLLNSWRKEGIDISHCNLMEGFNGIYFISLDGRDREFIYYRKGSAASQLNPTEVDSTYISKAKILFTSGITQAISENNRRYVRSAFKVSKKSGVKIAFDVNYRPKLWSIEEASESLKEVLGFIDILFLNSQEAKLFTGYSNFSSEIVEFFLSRGIKTVVIKKGGDGCFIAYKGAAIELPALKVAVKDTTGAGDAFNGGFLHAIARGFDPFIAAQIGNAVAGLKVRGRGAVLSLPKKEEVERELGYAI
jgi:2-dehydro-3-deoxygluconokinase